MRHERRRGRTRTVTSLWKNPRWQRGFVQVIGSKMRIYLQRMCVCVCAFKESPHTRTRTHTWSKKLSRTPPDVSVRAGCGAATVDVELSPCLKSFL